MNAQLYDLSTLDRGAEERVGEWFCDKWRIERLLGVGASGAVYAARHKNGNRVAIKVMHAELAPYAQVRDRFLNEARAANRVQHRAVLAVHDEGIAEDGLIFLVMDLLDGVSLEAYQERHGMLSCEQALLVAHEVLDALIASHAAGVLHRDIKPANLFLNWDGRVMLLDFGVARFAESRTTTQLGIPMGTPAFMPPEQAAGRWQDVDARSDLWSLGATLFTLLSGETVRVSNSAADELRAAIADPVRSLSQACDAPSEVAALVDRALRLDPAQRFQDAASMQREVLSTMRSLGITPPRASQPPVSTVFVSSAPELDTEPPPRQRQSSIRKRTYSDAATLDAQSEQWASRLRDWRPRWLRLSIVAGIFVALSSAVAFAVMDEGAQGASTLHEQRGIAGIVARESQAVGSRGAFADASWLRQGDLASPLSVRQENVEADSTRAPKKRVKRGKGSGRSGDAEGTEEPAFDPFAARE